ncbi:MAG TPA: DNA-formamidopyrimidine glycosylase family protein [Miltoncostaeaceae bacterium]|nr:DNA-formamidopyrimidine glycosylase family protein [Miltoncostaeaceae bacterium]
MPEGHTIHRAARRQNAVLAGHAIRTSSPQGRFAAGAAALDGRVLLGVEAVGKHLFHRWEGGEVLHVHLGLFGRFREHPSPPPPPRGAVRLRMEGPEVAVDLSGPTACELVGREGMARIVARLGEDPLRPDADPDRAIAALARRRIPIGAALLDQRLIAGLGNVFRAEALFVCGIDPEREARSLSPDQLRCLWDTSARMLRDGVRRGRIVTTDPREIGRPASRMRRAERTYVYGQEVCRRCGSAIEAVSLANRPCYRCPVCQA